MKRTHHAKFYHPGVFLHETSSRKVQSRDPGEIKMPANSYAFSFYDMVEMDAKREDGKRFTVRETEHESGIYYPGGEVMNSVQVDALGDDRLNILKSNMRANGYEFVVKTRLGNFQPFNRDDVIITDKQPL